MRRPWIEEIDRSGRVAQLALHAAIHTGLWSHVGPRGWKVLIDGLVRRRTNPSLVYRFQAASQPNKVAVRWREREITFREIDEEIDRIGGGLRARGLGRGSRVVIMLENRPEMIVLQPAMSRMGAAGVSISYRSTPAEISYLVRHSGAQAMFFESSKIEAVREASKSFEVLRPNRMFCVGGEGDGFSSYEELLEGPPTQPEESGEEAAVIIYTSGTTGQPKGAVRKFPRDVVEGTLQLVVSSPLRVDDVHLAVLPLYHSTAYVFASLSHVVGATVVLLDRFDPEGFLRAVQEHRVTQTALVPTLLHRILQVGVEEIGRWDTRSLRAILLAGAPLSGELASSAMDVFGDILFNYYGATETGLNTMAGPRDLRASPGTIGRALPGMDIRLLDEEGRDVAVGRVGELFVRGPMMVAGYHEDEASTRSSMRGEYFSVGDLAWVDDRGCYHLAGRKRDMIISGGVNVYPAEVERVIEALPGVAEVAVMGVPDEEWGERVCAVVVASKGGAEGLVDSVLSKCRRDLAGPKRPRQIEVVETLPRNPTGKVLKRVLRERYGKGVL